MEMVLSNEFCDLSQMEMDEIDGGVKWNDLGLYLAGAGGASVGMFAGGKVGATVGCIGGPGGSAIGAIVGGAAGIIIYTFWD